MPRFRPLISFAILSTFLGFILYSGIYHQIQLVSDPEFVATLPVVVNGHDFSQYNPLQTLSKDNFDIHDPERRVIVVGDIHGRFLDFQALLAKLKYDPKRDTLISAGDVIAKGPRKGSLDTLEFLSKHNITAVRGNHDQKVIEWRAWVNYINSKPTSKEWLKALHDRFMNAQSHLKSDDFDREDWVHHARKKDKENAKWWDTIPSHWKLFGPHFDIGREMSERDYQWMVERPLKIHIPHEHTYIVHAGLLSSNPRLRPDDPRQPLATAPNLKEGDVESARRHQEVAVMKRIPQNRDPWVTLNIRSVIKKAVSRENDLGTPWTDLFARDMSLCKGFKNELTKHALPCMPVTVVYGHAAARGLDINRWTLGLDSGCVYKRRLSALVLGGKFAKTRLDLNAASQDFEEDDAEIEAEDAAYDIEGKRARSVVRFGDRSKGKIVSVRCR